MTDDELTYNFTNHPPRDEQVAEVFDELTAMFTDVAIRINELLPESREKSLAITNLEQCSMWSKACVARNQDRV